MRDLSMEELGHVYGAGGKGHPHKCKKDKKKDNSHSYGSYSSDKKKKDCYPKKPPACAA